MMAKKFDVDTRNFNFDCVANVYEGLGSQEITKDLNALQAIHKPISERTNKNLYCYENNKAEK